MGQPKAQFQICTKIIGGIAIFPNGIEPMHIHSKLCSITPMATTMHMILHGYVVLKWMHGIIDLV
jgi:hypothetical protein